MTPENQRTIEFCIGAALINQCGGTQKEELIAARIAFRKMCQKEQRTIDIVFDGPPGHESGRFVEVEDENGASISIRKWLQRADGLWALRIAV